MTDELLSFANWVKTTPLAHLVVNSRWVWPACETLHFMGLAVMFGTIGLVDLRVLGVGKQLAFPPVHKLIRWGIGAFLVNVITGILFFCGDPVQYTTNAAFQAKMIMVALAGLNVALFYFTPAYRQTEALRPGDDAPAWPKALACASIFLWLGVTFWGRMLPFIGTAF